MYISVNEHSVVGHVLFERSGKQNQEFPCPCYMVRMSDRELEIFIIATLVTGMA